MTSENPNTTSRRTHSVDCIWHMDGSQCDCGASTPLSAADPVGPVSTTYYLCAIGYDKHYQTYRCYNCTGSVYLPTGNYQSFYCVHCAHYNSTDKDKHYGPIRADYAATPSGNRVDDTARADDSSREWDAGYEYGCVIGYYDGCRDGYKQGYKDYGPTRNR